MQIRPFTKQDMQQVIDLYRKCFAESPWFEEFDPEELKQEFSDVLSWPDGIFFVAEEDGRILGGAYGFSLARKTVVFDSAPETHRSGFYLSDLFVDSEHRKQGLAQKLTQHRVASAKAFGFTTGVVRTSVNQPIVQHLYIGKLGYTIHCEQEALSTKVYDGVPQEVTDTRIIMIGSL